MAAVVRGVVEVGGQELRRRADSVKGTSINWDNKWPFARNYIIMPRHVVWPRRGRVSPSAGA